MPVDKQGWPKSLWSRKRIQDRAKCYAKGGDVTNVLVDFAQEVIRLKEERNRLVKLTKKGINEASARSIRMGYWADEAIKTIKDIDEADQ